MYRRVLSIIEKLIFGKIQDITLQRRILILVTFYAIVTGIAGNIVNIALGFDKLLILTTFLIITLSIYFFFRARNGKKYQTIVYPLVFICIVFIVFAWLLNAGYDGNTINLIFVFFIGLFTIVSAKARFTLFIVFLALFICLILFQFQNPNLVLGYANNEQRFADILWGNILYFIFLTIMVEIILRNYSRENLKVTIVNKELEVKNSLIEISHRQLKVSEEKFRSMAEQIPDVLFLTNTVGEINYISPASEIVFERKAETMTGQLITVFLSENETVKITDFYSQLLTGEKSIDGLALSLVSESGIVRYVEFNATAFYIDENIAGSIGSFRDITERRQRENHIVKLSKGIEQSPTSVIITDIHGNIEYVNERFTKMTGYNYDEVIGHNPRILKSGYQDHIFYENLWNKVLSDQEWRGEILNRKKNGDYFWENTSIFPIKNNEGQIINLMAFKEDITQKKAMEQELLAAKEKAEEGDRLKSAFLANMSHEIRTPLNGILGFTNLLEKENISVEKKTRYAEIIRKSASSLLQIINDILDVSRIESGQLVIVNNLFDVNILINYLYALYKNKLVESDKKKLKIEVHLSKDELLIKTDESRLQQVFINLLDNSLKFTDTGYIEFGILTVDKDSVTFFVKDTGVGIPVEMKEKIFNRFTQLKDGNDNFRGNGLGLAIVKQLLELMRGEISVDSKPGEGSQFTFKIPIANTIK